MPFKENISLALSAGARGIWITSFEERRVRDDLVSVASNLGLLLFTWSSATGLTCESTDDQATVPPGARLAGALQYMADSKQHGMLVLFDAHADLQEIALRRARELVLYGTPICIVVSPKSEIPYEISHEFIPIPYRLPTMEELVDVIKKSRELSGPNVFPVAEAATGLTVHEAQYAIRRAVLSGNKKTQDLVTSVWDYKTEQIGQSGMLTISKPKEK